MERKVKAFAPATVANLCCGFDILGMAVEQPGDELTVTLTDHPGVVISNIVGDGGRLPREANKNTCTVAIKSYLQALGKTDCGLAVELHKNLPLGSGMGSSAASAVAGLVAVNHLLGSPLTKLQLLPHAMEAERIACGSAHADNVAPSLLGGFVLVRGYHPLDVVSVPSNLDLFVGLVHPHIEVKTEDSRKVLKPTVSLRDAITQNGNVAGLVLGLSTNNAPLICRSLKDVFAEPYRADFIPGFEQAKKAAITAGALGFGISGSGPTVFMLATSEKNAKQSAQAVQDVFNSVQLSSDVFVSSVNQQGAIVLQDSKI
ncbi:MAG: homoserine kinase [Flammeovirgaceae bacterium]